MSWNVWRRIVICSNPPPQTGWIDQVLYLSNDKVTTFPWRLSWPVGNIGNFGIREYIIIRLRPYDERYGDGGCSTAKLIADLKSRPTPSTEDSKRMSDTRYRD